MKKMLAIALALMLCLGLAACGTTVVMVENPEAEEPAEESAAPAVESEAPAEESEAPAEEPAETVEVPEGELALGFYMVAAYAGGHSGSTNATADANGLAQANVDIYAVTIDSNGVIVDCKIDAIQCKTNFDATGALVSEIGAVNLSKMELQDDYAMRGASSISAEWFEQVEALEDYCVGKTPAEVAGIALDDAGKATDADLIAGITMPLGSFIDGVIGACRNARADGAREGDTLYLHSVSAMSDSSKAATAEADGVAQNDTTAGAYTIDAPAAWAVAEQLSPRIIIPMHYRQGEKGFLELDTVDAFLSLCPRERIRRYPVSRLEVTGDTPAQVAVLALP